MVYILDYIKNNPNTWEEDISKKGIKIKKSGDLVLFIYNLLSNPDFNDPICIEARGIIIDIRRMKVVCRAFDKFFNFGEPYANDIDWSTARVQEKVDGSIIRLWAYGNNWCVSTNGTISAFEAYTNDSYDSFGSLFMQALMLQVTFIKDWLDTLDKDYTYIFELTSKKTQVIIDYGETPQIWHLGTRNNKTMEEVNIDIGIQKPKEYPLSSVEECVAAAAALNASLEAVNNEGFVVVDKNWHRIKIKSPEYVKLHHLSANGQLTDRRIANLIETNELDEFLSYFPSAKEVVDDYKKRKDIIRMVILWAEEEAQDIWKMEFEPKEKAKKIRERLGKYAWIGFRYKEHYVSSTEVIQDMPKSKYFDWMKELKDKS